MHNSEYEFADLIAMTACRSVLCEVCVTPKPGLVDRLNNGAHNDMDMFTFINSAMAIAPFFRRLALEGIAGADKTPALLFDEIRQTGMEAEKAMLEATNGVNTHKGVIFSLGLICAACGYMRALNMSLSADSIAHTCAEMTRIRLAEELAAVASPKTNGEKFYISHNVKGARGEAAAGFPSVLRYGLPVFNEMLLKGLSFNDAGAITLVSLMRFAEDTNMLKRSGGDFNIGREASAVFSKCAENGDLSALYKMDADFTGRNISPGGCADLLAVTFMFYFTGGLYYKNRTD